MSTRKRHQTGCVVYKVRQGKKVWLGVYRDANGKQCITEPLDAKTRAQAKSKMVEFLIPLNQQTGGGKPVPDLTTLAWFTEHVYIKYGMQKWKGSTAATTTQRLKQHVINGSLGQTPVTKLTRDVMQAFLDQYRDRPLTFVNHLRFDLSGILKIAKADGLVDQNQAEALYSPRTCVRAGKTVMTAEQVKMALAALDLRERLFCRFAIFAGMRPGEVSALKWSDIQNDTAMVDERLYSGKLDTVKTGKPRTAALPPVLLTELELWRQFALPSEFVFASETGVTPIWYTNLWQKRIQPRLRKLGLGWANFQTMRRTNATLMKESGADVKVGADQRGHNVTTSINEYTDSTVRQKQEVVARLERLVH